MRPTRSLLLLAIAAVGLVPLGPAAPAAPLTSAAPEPAATYTLWVMPTGDGSGTVSSEPAGIDCGPGGVGECLAAYDEGTQVTLAAAPHEGSTFVGWGGACVGTGACVVTMDGDLDVWAEFDAPVVYVDRLGDGEGAVTSDPGGILCDWDTEDCAEPYAPGTVVTLTATPDAGAVFAGWSGACSGFGACAITMGQEDVRVAAEFDSAWLTVQHFGDGPGTITSDPAGISCTEQDFDCEEPYVPGTEVALVATPGAVSVFLGWTGACSGTGTCVVTMDDDVEVGARFDTSTLVVTRTGDGSGTVTSAPGAISCPPTCVDFFLPGTMVTLTAAPADESAFSGWSDDCSGTGQCVLVLDTNATVDAGFDTGRVVVSRAGDGVGTVTSTPSGIDCPGDCRESYHPDTEVTLVATAGDESIFTGWLGDCTGTGACIVSAGADPQVTATFDTGRLTVTRDGLGAGLVTSEPAGIDCGEDCAEGYTPGTQVTLTPTEQAGSTFAGWSGDCTGTGDCVVTLDADRAVTATFNPPGTAGKIVYECAADICVMNEDGTDHQNLTNTPNDAEYAPTLSSDGTRIAFMSNGVLVDNPDRNLEIAAMNVDGTGLVQVTNSTGEMFGVWHNYDPDWSPDGTKIAFVTNRDSNPMFRQIYVINADGTGETMITDDADSVERLDPTWSPDGTKIAYTWWLGVQDVYVMNADGSGQTNLTDQGGWWDERDPAWSPDGTRIAFTTNQYFEPMTFNTDIMVIQSDGTQLTRVTDHSAIDESPTWSPDGEWIAFSSPRVGGYDIWAVLAPPPGGHADGVLEEGLQRLTDAPGPDLDPYWSDDAAAPMHEVKVKKVGNGKGKVFSTPTGIACGKDCSEAFRAGTVVTLSAMPADGSVFVGFSRVCESRTTCRVPVDAATTIKARFVLAAPTPGVLR